MVPDCNERYGGPMVSDCNERYGGPMVPDCNERYGGPLVSDRNKRYSDPMTLRTTTAGHIDNCFLTLSPPTVTVVSAATGVQ